MATTLGPPPPSAVRADRLARLDRLLALAADEIRALLALTRGRSRVSLQIADADLAKAAGNVDAARRGGPPRKGHRR